MRREYSPAAAAVVGMVWHQTMFEFDNSSEIYGINMSIAGLFLSLLLHYSGTPRVYWFEKKSINQKNNDDFQDWKIVYFPRFF